MRRRYERALAGVLTALVLVSTLAGPGAALAMNASTSTAAPAPAPAQVQQDLATVPDANVQANIPKSARGEISTNISKWRGSVMADQAADSLEVSLTTRAAATGRASPGGPQFALQLTDDEVPDGRTVAVPADAIEEAVGFTPVVVTGYHEDGTQWTASARQRGSLIVFDVPHFSTNTVTFGGTLSITGDPATDGSSYQYEVQDVDAVSDYQIDVTGSTAYDRENATAQLGNGESLPLEIAGNSDPLGPNGLSAPQVVLEGTESTSQVSENYTDLSGSSSTTAVVGGNRQPDGAEVTFKGTETTTSASTSSTGATDGSTTDYNVGGNTEPEGPSASNEPLLTFDGRSSTTSNDQTLTGISTGSHSITTNGNIEPIGPSANDEPVAEITSPSVSDADSITNFGTKDYAVYRYLGFYNSEIQNAEVAIKNPPSSVGAVTWNTGPTTGCDSGSGEVTIDVYGEGGAADSSWKSGTYLGSFTQTQSELGNGFTFEFDNPQSTDGNDWYSVGFHISSNGFSDECAIGLDHDSDTRSQTTAVSTADTSSGTDSSQNDVHAELIAAPESASVSDGSTTSSVSFSGYGQTQTTEFDMGLVQSIDLSGTPGGPVDVTIAKTDRTVSEDPAVDLNNDGTMDASYSGTLPSGETATIEVSSLSTGSHTASTSLTTGSVDWTLDWTEINALEDPSVSIGGTTAASYLGTIREGQSVTESLSGLELGTNTLEWGASTSGGGYSANVSWTERVITEDPSVDIDGDGSYEINEVGTIDPGETRTHSASEISSSTSTLGVATNNGSEVKIEAQYRETTKTEDPTVEVNGHETGTLGQLNDGETESLSTDSSWVQSGTNRINVSLGDGTLTADAPQSEVILNYQHESVDNQTVEYVAERWTERYNVSRKWLSDQESASLAIPFKDTVLSIRDVEKRVGNNDWTTLQSSDYALDAGQLTVQLGSISKNTEVGVRVNASRVRVNNGSIHVLEATEQGRKLDTQIAIDDWGTGSYIALPERENNLITYAYNESWSGPTDDYRVTADGERRLRLPNALIGGQTRISTLPVDAKPQTGDVVLSVGKVSSTEPKFVVQPGQTQGDQVNYTFVGAADGTDYILYSQTEGIVRDTGTAQSPLTLSDDDSDETLQFLVDEGEVSGPDDGGDGGFPLSGAAGVAVEEAQANPLGALLVAIIALTVLLGAYWTAKRRRRPKKGWIGEIASFVSTEVVLIGLTIIGVVLSIRFNILALPRETLFVGSVFVIELLGYLLLRYFGVFDWKVYGAASAILVFATTQVLVPQVFEQIAGSEAVARIVPLIAVAGLYLVYRAVETWRRGQVTQVVVGGDKQN